MKLKEMNELSHGACTVVCDDGSRHEGFYNSKLEIVFYAIPAHAKILGYVQ